MAIATMTTFVKSEDNRYTMPNELEPSTFLIPISFKRRSAVNAARPNKPRQEITIASPAKYFDNVATRFSALY